MKEQFEKEIHGLAQQIKGLHDMAVAHSPRTTKESDAAENF